MTDRQRSKKRAQKHKRKSGGGTKDDLCNLRAKKETDAEIMREKQRKANEKAEMGKMGEGSGYRPSKQEE